MAQIDPGPTDILREAQRLQRLKSRLVDRAGDLGLSAPRSCCGHSGDLACVSCSAAWLVERLR